MIAKWAADRLVAEVERLACRGLPQDEFVWRAAERFRRSVPADGICWATLDPNTRLMTRFLPQDLLASGLVAKDISRAGWQVTRSEYVVNDVNTAAGLADQRFPVGILSRATHGHPERSERYRELLAPNNIPYELRGTLLAGQRAWGFISVHRQERAGDFTAGEAALLARLARPLAEGLRGALRADAARRDDYPRAPGLVVLGRRDEVELITPPALELMDELRRPHEHGSLAGLPAAMLALAATTRNDRSSHRRAQVDGITVRTRAGWITLHASLPDGAGSDRVVVIVERARDEKVAAVRLEVYGLTAREREIAALIVAGMSTRDIVARLVISPHTVQDHLKSIFDKTGTRNRREFVARVFFADYLPRIKNGTSPDAHGTFSEHT